MKKIAVLTLSGLMLVGLSACGDVSEDDIKRDAHLIRVCKDNGGNPWVNIVGKIQCDMYKATKQ